MACLPSRPGHGAKTTLLCTGRLFRQWLQAGGGADNAGPAKSYYSVAGCARFVMHWLLFE